MRNQSRYHRVAKIAEVWKVLRGGYYAYPRRHQSPGRQRDRKLVAEIAQILRTGV